MENNSTEENLAARIFNIVIDQVLQKTHAGLDERGRAEMEKVFLSDDEKAKNDFVKKYIPNFENVFKEEEKKVRNRIVDEMLKGAQ